MPKETIIQVALLAIPSLGLPSGGAALTWIMDIVSDSGSALEMPSRGKQGDELFLGSVTLALLYPTRLQSACLG